MRIFTRFFLLQLVLFGQKLTKAVLEAHFRWCAADWVQPFLELSHANPMLDVRLLDHEAQRRPATAGVPCSIDVSERSEAVGNGFVEGLLRSPRPRVRRR
jgi:hypothetical protein